MNIIKKMDKKTVGKTRYLSDRPRCILYRKADLGFGDPDIEILIHKDHDWEDGEDTMQFEVQIRRSGGDVSYGHQYKVNSLKQVKENLKRDLQKDLNDYIEKMTKVIDSI